MLTGVGGGDGLQLWKVVQEASRGHLVVGLHCQLLRAYFPSLIQELVEESWLNIPACYQALPTGK